MTTRLLKTFIWQNENWCCFGNVIPITCIWNAPEILLKMFVKQFFITNNNQITINFGTWTNDSASVNPLQPGDA